MKKFYYSLICAFMVFSCAKTDEPVNVPQEPEEVSVTPVKVFSAYLEIPESVTKTSLSDNGDGTYKLLWSNGDRIRVTDGTKTAVYSTTSTDVKADFTLMSGTEPTGPTFYACYYGISGGVGSDTHPVAISTDCKFTVNSSYIPTSVLHDRFFNPMYAESASASLNFKNIFGVLKLSLSGAASDNIGAVTISADQSIAGEVTIVADGSAFKAVVSGDTQQTVKFNYAATYRQLSDGLVLYIPLAPNDYTNFKISVYNQDRSQVCVKSAKSAIAIERSKLSSITLTNIAFTPILDGAGTEADPFQIKTEGDIQTLSSTVRNTGASYSGKYFKVMNNITLTEAHVPFSLTCAQFDGNGKTITLENGFEAGITSVGLFSSLKGKSDIATVKDLTVSGTVTLADITKYGTIAASMGNPCIISNCTSNVDVTVDNTAGNTSATVGGIAGNDANEYYCRIENCRNTGDISVEGGGFSVGGVAAYVQGSIVNSGNSGDITVSGNGLHKVGGITGSTTSGTNDSVVIDGCYSTGNIVTYSSSTKTSASTYAFPLNISQTSYAGGIVGNSQFPIRNCYNTGTVTATRCAITSGGTTAVALAGGITGYGGNIRIENCFNLGDITAQGGNVNNDHYYQPFAGGISAVGGVIINSYNAGTMTTKSYSSGGTYLGVTEQLYGGIIGLKYTNNSVTYGAAVNCYSLSGKGSIIGCVQTISSTATINKSVFPSESGGDCSMFDSSLQSAAAVNIGGAAYAAGSSLLELLNAGQASLGSEYKTWKTGDGSPSYPVFND